MGNFWVYFLECVGKGQKQGTASSNFEKWTQTFPLWKTTIFLSEVSFTEVSHRADLSCWKKKSSGEFHHPISQFHLPAINFLFQWVNCMGGRYNFILEYRNESHHQPASRNAHVQVMESNFLLSQNNMLTRVRGAVVIQEDEFSIQVLLGSTGNSHETSPWLSMIIFFWKQAITRWLKVLIVYT